MTELIKNAAGESLPLVMFGFVVFGVLALFGLLGRLAEWMLGEDE
jgi:hypothetical protein